MATGGGDLTVAQQLHDWVVNTMQAGRHFGAEIPTVEELQVLCRGQTNNIWRYVIAHVRSTKQQMHNKALQPEAADKQDVTQVDLVAKKRALMSELASTVSESQVLERDNGRLRKDIITAERSYRSAVSQINDMRHQKALLQAHCELAKETVMRTEEFTQQIQHQHEMLTELHRKSSQPPLMISRSAQSADAAGATNLETVSVKIVRETCELVAAFLEQLYQGSFEGDGQAMSRSKEELWKQVEAALSNVTAKELLSALCVHADETAATLVQKTAAIDIAKDAEKLRFKYEQGGRLSDLSSPPSVLQSVHQLVETAQAAMFTKFIKTEQHKNNSWQLQKRLSEASVAIDDRLRQLYNDPQVLQLVRKLVDTETQLASTRASISALNAVSAELTSTVKQATTDKQILYAKYQKIQDFNKLAEKKQDLIQVLVKQNMNARTRLETQQSENTAYMRRMSNSHVSEVERLSGQLKDSVTREANAFTRLPLSLLPTVTMPTSGQKVAVVDLSIHKLDADLPHTHCSRTIAKLLSDLNIPPFITSELFLPRIAEIRTDCAETKMTLHVRRRDKRIADVEGFAAQLTKLCEAVEQQDQQLVGHLLPVIKQRTDDATQALSDCLEVKDLIVYWWEQPAQLCTPWITVDGLNMQQWLNKWKVIASRLRQLPAASTTHMPVL